MNLKGAPRIEHGRCAALPDTVARLEAALDGVCAYEYIEERVCDLLYWGECRVDTLGFPPMGKGDSALKCKASTLAETVEWLALRRRRELPGHTVAHQAGIPGALPIEALLSHVAGVTPELLERIKNTEAAQHWVDGYSLTGECPLKIPLEYLNGISGTNGVAAGNRIEEAIVQGALEVIERRAVITAIRNRMTLPTIDTATIDDRIILSQLAFLEENGVQVIVKDLSFDGALPCIGACFVNNHIDIIFIHSSIAKFIFIRIF